MFDPQEIYQMGAFLNLSRVERTWKKNLVTMKRNFNFYNCMKIILLNLLTRVVCVKLRK